MTARFGVSIVPSASGRSDPVAEAVRAEALGYDLVTVWDHPNGEAPSFETWTLMTWMAARTVRIGIGSNVLAMPLRHPALTAKMAETLDRLSNGRLILGLGAGGDDAELAAYGAGIEGGAEKIEALEEGLSIIRGVWSEPVFTYDGKYHRNHGTQLEPKPARAIPIWLGTYGRRALEITGRLADGWLPSMRFAPPDVVAAKRRIVLAALEGAGRDPSAFDWAYNVGIRVGGPPAPDPDRQVAGDAAELADRIGALLEAGFTVLNFWFSGRRDEQMERLATDVLPGVARFGRARG